MVLFLKFQVTLTSPFRKVENLEDSPRETAAAGETERDLTSINPLTLLEQTVS
jgi:hypothetical protein